MTATAMTRPTVTLNWRATLTPFATAYKAFDATVTSAVTSASDAELDDIIFAADMADPEVVTWAEYQAARRVGGEARCERFRRERMKALRA